MKMAMATAAAVCLMICFVLDLRGFNVLLSSQCCCCCRRIRLTAINQPTNPNNDANLYNRRTPCTSTYER